MVDTWSGRLWLAATHYHPVVLCVSRRRKASEPAVVYSQFTPTPRGSGTADLLPKRRPVHRNYTASDKDARNGTLAVNTHGHGGNTR